MKTNTAQRRARSALWGRKRDAKLDAAPPNRDRIGSACHIDHGIRRHSGHNSATAALAIEAGPLGGKSERTEGMPHLG